MGRRSTRRTLRVAMNGDPVARLTHHPARGLELQYAPEWLDRTDAIPISLSLPLTREPFGEPLVSSYFDNLLPDRRSIRERMQRVLGTATATPFDLLSVAGADCVGALQLSPDEALPDVRTVEATPVSESDIAAILDSYREHPLGMTADDEFRISIAGAQEKTAFLRRGGQWYRPHGTTPTTHIFKLPLGVVREHFDLSTSVENEWLCLEIARRLGLPVANAEIRRFEDKAVLVVERFDRRWSTDGSWVIRLPQEDFCQALGIPSALKYESDGGPGILACNSLLMKSSAPLPDRTTFFRALIVYYLLAAIDGHAKNFSVQLYPGGQFRLAPMYDVLSAYPVVSKHVPMQRLKLAMALHGKNRHYRLADIQRRHFLETAKRCAFPEDQMNDLLGDVLTRVDPGLEELTTALHSTVPQSVSDPIVQGVRRAASALASG